LQRNALYILAEKSLELAKEPDYFKSIPEYDEVSKTLAQKHQTALETYGRREKMDEEYRKRQFDQNVDYELRRHNVGAPLLSFSMALTSIPVRY